MRTGGPPLVQLDGLTARIRVEQERLGDAMVWAERAAAGARATDDAERLVLALVFLDTVEIYMGVPGLGARHLEALQICIDENLRPLEEVVRGNLGTLSYFAGRWTEAAEWYRTAREVAMEVGKDFGAAETGVNLGELLINQGHVDDAELLLTDALRVLRASGAALFIAQGEVQLARVRLMRGDNAAAEELGAATAARLLELDKATSALEASLVQADAMIREGRARAGPVHHRRRGACREHGGGVGPPPHLPPAVQGPAGAGSLRRGGGAREHRRPGGTGDAGPLRRGAPPAGAQPGAATRG